MIDPKHLDDLARRLSAGLPSGIQLLQDDLKRNLRASLEDGLRRLDLVSREEFDAQAAVLARTREKLERLERQVADMERQAEAPTDSD
jgi:BMFP domain-containing protein YqiC